MIECFYNRHLQARLPQALLVGRRLVPLRTPTAARQAALLTHRLEKVATNAAVRLVVEKIRSVRSERLAPSVHLARV